MKLVWKRIQILFFNFYCITAHVSPPKVRYPIKPIDSGTNVNQAQFNDVQNVKSDWIKVVEANKGNRFGSNYYPSQLPPFPPLPPPLPLPASSSRLLSSASSHQSLPIYSTSDNQNNLDPSGLKLHPQVSSSSLSSSTWSKVYPSGQSGSVIWPNQVNGQHYARKL
uniref:Uncharacterized protein n=1 Tax=Tetranychus urticae TaxID=32264 RepID=T1KUG6_TETUR